MTAQSALDRGTAAMSAGDWAAARTAFEAAVLETGSAASLAGLGDALFFLGDMREAVRFRERAYAVSLRSGDRVAAVDSAIWLCLSYGMALGNRVAANGWHTRARSVLAGDESVLPRGWLAYEGALLTTDTARSHELLEHALAVARDVGNRDLELCALAERGVARVKLGETAAGLSDVDEAMAGVIAGEPADFFTVVMSACSMMTVCDITGDLDRARAWSDAADALMEGRGCPYLFAECRVSYGRVLMLSGRWPEAEAEFTRAATVARGAFPAIHARVVAGLAELRTRQGRLEEAGALIERAGAPIQAAVAAAGLALRLGDPASAVALVGRWFDSDSMNTAVPMHAGGHGHSIEAATALAVKIEALLELGECAAATSAAAILDERSAVSRPGIDAAHAALAHGRLATEASVAVRCFERSLELFAAMNLPLETGRVRLELARRLAPDSPPLATAEARAALNAFDRLGASGDGDIAAEILRSLGAPGRHVPRSSARLTRREQEVLDLIADGLTNPEIAARLHISRKTAAHHVSNLLAKLGASNRVQAVKYASGNRTGA
ncbi:LuxR C-terminal-related transcriptional regulator [Agromyces sp. NPDC058484]|uniref:LuxR C-terminal-related transcriptional regulator n=1 Tax=Agromyces sp. NPDC058484 TaxID=3346524 RepID=UPI0036691571